MGFESSFIRAASYGPECNGTSFLRLSRNYTYKGHSSSNARFRETIRANRNSILAVKSVKMHSARMQN